MNSCLTDSINATVPTIAQINSNIRAVYLPPLECTSNGRSYTWDIQNRMLTCTVDGNTRNYTYRTDGLRLTKTAGGVTTEYLYDGQQPLIEMKSDGTRTDYLLGFTGHPLGRTITNAQGNKMTQWYRFDGLGSVTGIADANYNIIQTMEYDV